MLIFAMLKLEFLKIMSYVPTRFGCRPCLIIHASHVWTYTMPDHTHQPDLGVDHASSYTPPRFGYLDDASSYTPSDLDIDHA